MEILSTRSVSHQLPKPVAKVTLAARYLHRGCVAQPFERFLDKRRNDHYERKRDNQERDIPEMDFTIKYALFNDQNHTQSIAHRRIPSVARMTFSYLTIIYFLSFYLSIFLFLFLFLVFSSHRSFDIGVELRVFVYKLLACYLLPDTHRLFIAISGCKEEYN